MSYTYIVPGVISGGMKIYLECFTIVDALLRDASYGVVDEPIENTASNNIIKAHGTLVKQYKVTKDRKDANVDIRHGYSSDPDRLPHYTIIVNGNDKQFVENVVEKLGEIQRMRNGGRRLKKIHRKRKTRRLKKTRRTSKTRRT